MPVLAWLENSERCTRPDLQKSRRESSTVGAGKLAASKRNDNARNEGGKSSPGFEEGKASGNNSKVWPSYLQVEFNKLLRDWVGVLSAILNPWALVLLAVTIVVFKLAAQQEADQQADKVVTDFLLFIGGLLSAAVGGLWIDRYKEEQRRKEIASVGRESIRNISNISVALFALIDNANDSLAGGRSMIANPSFVDLYIRSVINQCRAIYAQLENSINIWQDFLPQSDLQKRLEDMANLLASETQILSQLGAIGESAAEAPQRQRLERELNDIRNQRLAYELELGKLGKGPFARVVGTPKPAEPAGPVAASATTGNPPANARTDVPQPAETTAEQTDDGPGHRSS